MQIDWKNIDKSENKIIEGWLSDEDRKMLCMEEKNWETTANDIRDCLKFMKHAQFRNAIGYVAGQPACAVMFGVEYSGRVLRIYNLVVNPGLRNLGIGKQMVRDVFSKENKFELERTYSKITTSTLPQNRKSQKIFESNGFHFDGYNDDYVDFSKDVSKELGK